MGASSVRREVQCFKDGNAYSVDQRRGDGHEMPLPRERERERERETE